MSDNGMKCEVTIELRAGDVLVAVSNDSALFGQVFAAMLGIRTPCHLCHKTPTEYCCNAGKQP